MLSLNMVLICMFGQPLDPYFGVNRGKNSSFFSSVNGISDKKYEKHALL